MPILLVINVDNVVDVITNSSSELFVLKGEEIKIVEEMIENIYPNYKGEYDNLKRVEDLTNDDLDNFLSYYCSPHVWPAKKSNYKVLDGFTFEEMYEPEKNYVTGEIRPAWNGEIQYELKNNLLSEEDSDGWQGTSFVTDENRDRVIKSIIKSVGNFFLYSLDENPDWDMQEKLMTIGERFHLG